MTSAHGSAVLRAMAYAGLWAVSACQTPSYQLRSLSDQSSDVWIDQRDLIEMLDGAWVLKGEKITSEANLLGLLAGNADVSGAVYQAKIAQAVLARRVADGNTTLSASGSVTGRAADDGDVTDGGRAALSLSRRLDFSGELKARERASYFNWQASRADLAESARRVSGDIASLIVDIHFAKRNLVLLNEQIESNRTQLELVRLRFLQGQVDVVDVLQQQSQLEAITSRRPDIVSSVSRARSQLDALSGRTFGVDGQNPDNELVLFEDVLARIGLTTARVDAVFADLEQITLERPDVYGEWQRLQQADALYAAALAARLPSVDLGSDVVGLLANGDVTGLIDATLNSAWTLLDGGALRADVEGRQAGVELSARRFLSAALSAADEYQQSRALVEANVKSIAQIEQRLETARALLKAARERYLRGATDYLPVLTAIQTVQQLEQDALALEALKTRLQVQLITASGGGFASGLIDGTTP